MSVSVSICGRSWLRWGSHFGLALFLPDVPLYLYFELSTSASASLGLSWSLFMLSVVLFVFYVCIYVSVLVSLFGLVLQHREEEKWEHKNFMENTSKHE